MKIKNKQHDSRNMHFTIQQFGVDVFFVVDGKMISHQSIPDFPVESRWNNNETQQKVNIRKG